MVFEQDDSINSPMVLLNGVETVVPGDGSIYALLDAHALLSKRLAVELNGEIVPRTAWSSCTLMIGDRVEIVHAIGGG